LIFDFWVNGFGFLSSDFISWAWLGFDAILERDTRLNEWQEVAAIKASPA